jgi:predicted transcriptional regulator|tara:strand:+ start:293 stop:568 length:276 start_codon:yes stop_codon:yes gene_type:complete
MYNLEKVPSKSFKELMLYLDTVKGDGKKRVRQEAQEFLENKDKIVFDDLEQTLIDESKEPKEKNELKAKILNAKIKRIEKVLDKIVEDEKE